MFASLLHQLSSVTNPPLSQLATQTATAVICWRIVGVPLLLDVDPGLFPLTLTKTLLLPCARLFYFSDYTIKANSVFLMSGPSKRPGDEGIGWQNNKKKKKNCTSRHERAKARAKAGVPKKDHAYIADPIPGGFVTGDRVFYRDKDTGKAIYSDIEYGKYGTWRDIGDNGVYWGEGDGGVWIHMKRPARDVHAWEILKMDVARLEFLHERNLKRVKANQKPVRLPLLFEKLVQDRDLERLAKDEANSALEKHRVEMNRAMASMTSAKSRQHEAESHLADLQARHRAVNTEESNARDSVFEASEALRVARDKAIAEATTLAEEKRLLKLELEADKDSLASANGELNAELEDSNEKLREAKAEVDRMKAETATRVADFEQLGASSERYNLTFGVEAAEIHCIDLELDSDLPPVLADIRHSVKYTHWAGWEDEGHSTSWLAPAFARLLDLRSR